MAVSYAAVVANAFCARRHLVAGDNCPPDCAISSAITDVIGRAKSLRQRPQNSWRRNESSMGRQYRCSRLAHPKSTPGLATRLLEGIQIYHHHVDTVDAVLGDGGAMSQGSRGGAKMPPCTFGWRVLTRPSSISGKPVNWEISFDRNARVASNLAVPPVEINSTSNAESLRAKSARPVLVRDAENGTLNSGHCKDSISAGRCVEGVESGSRDLCVSDWHGPLFRKITREGHESSVVCRI